MPIAYLDLVDYLLIAEAVTGTPAVELARMDRMALAASAVAAPAAGVDDVDAYPDFVDKAAVLCWHLINNHPLPDGNKRAGFLAMVEFVSRNGYTWCRSDSDPVETDDVISGVAAGTIDRLELREWIQGRLSTKPR